VFSDESKVETEPIKNSERAEVPKKIVNIIDIKNILATRKGQNLSAVFGKELKTRKGVQDCVEKVTSIVVRGGIDYDNQALVKEGREDGSLPEENAGLPWGQWAEFPYHITHKDTDYVRFYSASGLSFEPKVEYYLNGELTTKETIQPLCLASEFPNRQDAPLAMTVKAENVKAILI
jgi:hypothetical protein